MSLLPLCVYDFTPTSEGDVQFLTEGRTLLTEVSLPSNHSGEKTGTNRAKTTYKTGNM